MRQKLTSEFDIDASKERKRIKVCPDLQSLIKEYGSEKVIGMLQAFSLVENEIRTQLANKER